MIRSQEPTPKTSRQAIKQISSTTVNAIKQASILSPAIKKQSSFLNMNKSQLSQSNDRRILRSKRNPPPSFSFQVVDSESIGYSETAYFNENAKKGVSFAVGQTPQEGKLQRIGEPPLRRQITRHRTKLSSNRESLSIIDPQENTMKQQIGVKRNIGVTLNQTAGKYNTMNLGHSLLVGLITGQSNSSVRGEKEPEKDDNLYHGLTPRQFVEELDRQVNLKQIIANSNDPMFGKKTHGPFNSKLSKKASPNTSRLEGNGSQLMMRDSMMSDQSNISSATDRLKRILAKQPIHIKGAGFEETPYQKLLVEEILNKPARKLDFIQGVDRTQKFLQVAQSTKEKEQKLYESLEKSLQPLVLEKIKQKTEQGKFSILSEGRTIGSDFMKTHQLMNIHNETVKEVELEDDEENQEHHEELPEKPSQKALHERLVKLHQKINMGELQKILKGITKIHSKTQKQLLPNIDSNKRYHLSYAQLKLRENINED